MSTTATGDAASLRQARDGERRHLTVLFCDLVDSTGIAGRLDPEDWHKIAAEYQATVTAAVTRFSGHVAKYLGDGLMVYFGWPEAHEDDTELAIRSSLAIVDEVAALNGRLAPEYGIRLLVRVGIHRGSVVVGRGGATEGEAFGDVPDVASSVQSAAEPGSVLITAAVHELVSGLFAVEDRGAQLLKNIQQPVHLYRAIRHTVARRRRHGAATRAQTPFVGREGEMRFLLNRWERSRDGRGQVVLVIGEPGIGKSRLVDEFRERIRSDPHLWVECAGEQFFQSAPFHAVIQILDQGLGGHGDKSPEERVGHLERGLERARMNASEAVPLIAELLNLPIPEKYPLQTFTADQKRRRLLANLAAWLLNLARAQPLVMVIEDLHWVDASTLELMQALIEQVAMAPLMLIFTARPEFRASWPMRSYHAQITLSRLNDRDTRDMVVAVVARAALAQELIDTVAKRTDGVPLFAEELTRLLLEGDGRSVAREIPATLRDSLTARLDHLGSAKEVAQIAAVIGREFSFDLLKAISSIGETELQSGLEKLVGAELIYVRGMAPEATYQFKHTLIRDAAYEALLKSRRKELHRRIAQRIDANFLEVEGHAEVVAWHWTEAGEAEPATTAWKKAAEEASGRRAFKEAEERYRHALSMLKTMPESEERDARELELASSLIHVLQHTKGYSAAETDEVAAHAQAVAEKSGSLAELVIRRVGMISAVILSGDYPSGTALADQLLDLAQHEGSDASLAFAHLAQIATGYYRGDLIGVEKHLMIFNQYQQAPGLSRFPGAAGIAFGLSALGAWLAGRADSARARTDRAIVVARSTNSPYELAHARHFEGILYLELKEFNRAEAAAMEAMTLSAQHDFLYIRDEARVILGGARAQLGRCDEGVSLIHEGLSNRVKNGSRADLTFYLLILGEAQTLQGNIEEALLTIERSLETNPEELIYRPLLLNCRGQLRLQLAQAELAEDDFLEAVSLAKKMSAKTLELRAATSLARSLQSRGEHLAAHELLAPLCGSFTEGFDTADLKEAKALLELSDREA